MKLMTKEIEKAARKQYPMGADLESQKVVGKFFDPCGSWTWYVLNQDPETPDYLWGIVDGYEVEMGSFSLSELQTAKLAIPGLSIERDKFFEPMPAKDLWERLMRGEHV